MNKGQLVEQVASELGDTKASASRAVDAVINSITNGIKVDESVTAAGRRKQPRSRSSRFA